MGSALSSHAKGTKTTLKEPVGVRGRTAFKPTSNPEEPELLAVEGGVVEPVLFVDAAPTITDTESEVDEEESASVSSFEDDIDEECDEGFDDRLAILADCKKLKFFAQAYLHPEEPVKSSDPQSTARCYFDRASAPEMESTEEAEACAQILADAAALKKLAVDYLHPEFPAVVTDPTATARCYFDRASAPEVESGEEAEARAQVLADAATLKKLAVDYMHPELPVSVADPTATARCYFNRASAPEVDSTEEADARAQVLADAAALKKLAVDYLHPEFPVAVTDPTASARCYFERASAPEVESAAEAELRAQVLADAAALKMAAVAYTHPELPVSATDPTATARCYFDRASAPEVESAEDAEARAQILADAAALKKLTVDYMHPELPVSVADSTATARCYFDRASAPEVESVEEAEARAQIMADAAALKKLAVDYLHPELPVSVTDSTATARCYFHRASALEVESVEEAEARAQILADAAALKKLAVDYLHPEVPVSVTDSTAAARCFFDRASAPEVESMEDAEARAQILADAAALKKLAMDYLHPEVPVCVTDSTATARCYFDRASAPEAESTEEAEARAQILADAAALKKLAADYLHPEVPVSVTDSTATARCYFDRASASEVESMEEAEARAQILADAAALKKLAADYLHPEVPVSVTDSTATARCYFDRASAPEVESAEDAEARAQILADAAALKKLAVDYLHPEVPVSVTDPTATARCYFDRASAPEVESAEEVEARAQILADAAALKKLAVDYLHPERPVVVTDPTSTARCYFDRASAACTHVAADISSHDEDEDILGRSDMDLFDYEDDVFHEIKESFTKFTRSHSIGLEEESKVMDKEEEGKLSRSPSSVMLFDLAGERSY